MLRLPRLLFFSLFIPIIAFGQEAAPDSHESAALTDALSATYTGHAAGARAVDWEGNVLQDGDNGYTCMPTPPGFAERGVTAPMCLDAAWLAWADAWQNKKPFSTDRIGIAYMLTGDGGASNIDPFAEGPTDDNEWIVEGPHLMIIAPRPLLEGIPTDPSDGGPYVMWKGTDYEHVMVPVEVPELPAPEGLLADALSASDMGMTESVTVVDWDGNVLQEGDGRYTCMPTPPQLAPGPAPMCFDEPWMGWADAWMNKKPFSAKRLGISYMLAGDRGASNVDPYAEGPTDENDWVVEGPHMMLIVPESDMLTGISRDPDNGGPYVMWDGTPYEHVMVPVADRP